MSFMQRLQRFIMQRLQRFMQGMQRLQRFIMQRLQRFMQGRYGMDSLNVFFLFLAALLWLINLFIRPFVPSLILWLIEVALVVLALLRCLSRNINMRALENRRLNNLTVPVRKWLKFQFIKFRDRKKCKYLKCIACKAQLRVRNLPGVHNVRCPKCGKEFQVKLK